MNNKLIRLLIGIGCLVLGIVLIVSHFRNSAKQTAEATAKIIRLDSDVEYDADAEIDVTYFTPVVEYTVDNQNYEKQLPNSRTSNYSQYKVGDTVEIIYNPENPNEISEKGNKGTLIGGIVATIGGIALIISFFMV